VGARGLAKKKKKTAPHVHSPLLRRLRRRFYIKFLTNYYPKKDTKMP
jgi:hypothetical protein